MTDIYNTHTRSSSIQWTHYLLRRDLVVVGSHVDLLVGVDTREDEEHAGAPGSPHQQPAQPEDDGPLILLEHYKVEIRAFMRNQNFEILWVPSVICLFNKPG